jgi:hypothetical protein
MFPKRLGIPPNLRLPPSQSAEYDEQHYTHRIDEQKSSGAQSTARPKMPKVHHASPCYQRPTEAREIAITIRDNLWTERDKAQNGY